MKGQEGEMQEDRLQVEEIKFFVIPVGNKPQRQLIPDQPTTRMVPGRYKRREPVRRKL
jgi:hypothetical protein